MDTVNPSRLILAVPCCLSLAGCFFFAKENASYQESGITQLMQITTDPSLETDPAWSPDGSKIAFASDRGGPMELWLLPVRGGGIQQLTVGAHSADRSPSFAPSQTEIVFQSTRVAGSWNIWKVSLGNRGLTQLTNNANGCHAPAWSPDGKHIAYDCLDQSGNSTIWMMGPSGEEPTQLGPGRQPSWSPDGKKLALARFTEGHDQSHIWLTDADGGNAEQMTSAVQRHESQPAFSRDGKLLAFVVHYDNSDYFSSSETSTRTKNLRSEIWTIDMLGRNATQLTAFRGFNAAPAWAPDGRITFVSTRSGSADLWSMRPLQAASPELPATAAR